MKAIAGVLDVAVLLEAFALRCSEIIPAWGFFLICAFCGFCLSKIVHEK